MQNIFVIGRIYLKLEHSEFSSNFEFDRNMLSGTGARSSSLLVYGTQGCSGRPGVISCNGRRVSENLAYGSASFIRQRCLLGKGVSGYAIAGALASGSAIVWAEWHAFWRVGLQLLARGHLPRVGCGSCGPVSWSFLWARRRPGAHQPSAQGLWAEGWPNRTVL